jgi:hypothetical protein
VRAIHVSKNQSSITQLGLSTGNLPSFVCIGFVPEENYRGTAYTNPYEFTNHRLAHSHLQINGSNTRIPGIKPGYQNMAQYISFMQNLNLFKKNNIETAITLERFVKGYSFQTFNLQNDTGSFLKRNGADQQIPGSINYNATFERLLDKNIVGVAVLIFAGAQVKFLKDGSIVKNYII